MHVTIIVGGSYAGISAGLQLARARRDVLVLDAGQRRTKVALTSLFTRQKLKMFIVSPNRAHGPIRDELVDPKFHLE